MPSSSSITTACLSLELQKAESTNVLSAVSRSSSAKVARLTGAVPSPTGTNYILQF